MSTLLAERPTMTAPAPKTPTELDPRWPRVQARDRSADGEFFYSVATTGVYCRPSCAARPANPKNVAFHTTTAQAEAAGFRACLRCRPYRTVGSLPWDAPELVCRAVQLVIAGALDGDRP
jgi:AraC family transcriptional regulator of adaptative response/methylated-DNA-[protein]-cysteine methyltransferase